MKKILIFIIACFGLLSCERQHHEKLVKVRHFKTGEYAYRSDDGFWYFYILNDVCYSSNSSTQPNFSGGRWMQIPDNPKNIQEEEQEADEENEMEVDIAADETDASSVDSNPSDSSSDSGDSGGDGGGGE